MRVDLFDFELPEAQIALRPVAPRDAARLLVVHPAPDALADRTVRDLPALLRAGDALVLNDTRVLPARLRGVRARPGGGEVAVELLLHRREGPDLWRALARPAKRLAPGDSLRFGDLTARLEARGEAGEVTLRFDRGGGALDVALAAVGELPLPPYIAAKRPVDAADARDYQTRHARADGAVAAPTAGLHFTDDLVRALDAAGISRHHVTLHVGAGTFLPVKAEEVAEHRMHPEWGSLTAETADALNRVREAGGRIVAVGTTSFRLLESAADADGRLQAFEGDTRLFVTPGYRVRAVDALLTNFHLPRSTLFMLVCAFSGFPTMRAAYAHAIQTGYRFYSYGDASLLFPAPHPVFPAPLP